jgi:hypothetical protein
MTRNPIVGELVYIRNRKDHCPKDRSVEIEAETYIGGSHGGEGVETMMTGKRRADLCEKQQPQKQQIGEEYIERNSRL